MTDELEKKPQARPVPVGPVKSSHKLAAFLSYQQEQQAEMLKELPFLLRVPMQTILTWAAKHKDELIEKQDPDVLDEFLAQYADALCQMRSDDAEIGMRVIGFADPRDARAFDTFLAHRDEIVAELEKRGAAINEERPKELSVGDGPDESELKDESAPVDNDDDEVDDVGNF